MIEINIKGKNKKQRNIENHKIIFKRVRCMVEKKKYDGCKQNVRMLLF